eukprot:scaffold50789_cov19-Tisochrysis_lutea.AAC.1
MDELQRSEVLSHGRQTLRDLAGNRGIKGRKGLYGSPAHSSSSAGASMHEQTRHHESQKAEVPLRCSKWLVWMCCRTKAQLWKAGHRLHKKWPLVRMRKRCLIPWSTQGAHWDSRHEGLQIMSRHETLQVMSFVSAHRDLCNSASASHCQGNASEGCGHTIQPVEVCSGALLTSKEHASHWCCCLTGTRIESARLEAPTAAAGDASSDAEGKWRLRGRSTARPPPQQQAQQQQNASGSSDETVDLGSFHALVLTDSLAAKA